MGAVLAVDGGSRNVMGADIDAGVSEPADERSAIGPQAINLSDCSRIKRDLTAALRGV
jgi:hypothetical protein